MGRIEGKIALVTGAASGIGEATAVRLRTEGATVVGVDVTPADGVEALDVTDEAAVDTLVGSIVERHGRIDGVVHAAGVAGGGPVHLVGAADWDHVLHVNLTGTFLVAKHAIARMLDQQPVEGERGSIVTIASIEGLEGTAGGSVYNASKGGVVLLTKNMAIDYGARGIRVNAICPGFIKTPMTDSIYGMPGMEVSFEEISAEHKLKRLGEPSEIASVALFLLSSDASFVTGQAIAVDGGYTAGRDHGVTKLLGPVVTHTLVTGGGAGIGGAVVDALATAGVRVTFVEIDEDLAVARVAAAPGEVEAVIGDAADPDLIAGVAPDLGAVDVLVNNVGHHLGSTPFLSSDPERWAALREVNFDHALRWSHALVPGMVDRGRGAVVNVSSVEGLRAFPRDPVYAAYKAALLHFTRSFAMEVASSGVRVNAVAPDVTQTPQVDYATWVKPEDEHRWATWVPLGRVGTPEETAEVVAFLASDASRFVTGQVIATDGGTLTAGGWFRDATGRWTNRPKDA